MAWLESHQTLRDHPKTLRASKILGISRQQVIGHLMFLWWWALDYAQDGELTSFAPDELESVMAWEGESGTLYAALINCRIDDKHAGFLEKVGSRVFIHDWDKFRHHYESERNCGKYVDWRVSVFHRDNYTCQKCGKRGDVLNAHHISAWANDKNRRFDIDNGMTLCYRCHRQEHGYI